MSRGKKILAVALCAPLVIIAALVVALLTIPDSEPVRRSITDKLQEITKQKVELGALKVGLFSPAPVSLKGERFVIHAPDGGTPLLAAERVVFVPDLWSLIVQAPIIRSVTIESFQARIDRDESGAIAKPFIPIPAQTPASPARSETPPPPGPAPEPKEAPAARPVPAGKEKVRLSIEKVTLKDAVLTFRDRAVNPGTTEQLTATLSADMDRKPGETSFHLKTSGTVTAPSRAASAFNADLVISPDAALSRIEGVKGTINTPDFVFDTFAPWLKRASPFTAIFSSARINTETAWARGKPGVITIDAAFKTGDPEPRAFARATVDVDGELRQATGGKGSMQVKSLSLGALTLPIPLPIPLDIKSGALNADMQGEWAGNTQWKASGNFSLEGVGLKGIFQKISPHVRITGAFSGTPAELAVNSLEIAGKEPLLTFSGKLTDPFSGEGTLDVQLNTHIRSEWLKLFAPDLPKEFKYKGPIPLKGFLKGAVRNPLLDATANLDNAHLEWTPFLEKPAGSPGVLRFVGRPATLQSGTSGPADVSIELHGARVGAEGHAIKRGLVESGGKLVARGRGYDLNGFRLSVRSADGAKANVTGELKDLGTDAFRTELAGVVTVDKETVGLFGLPAEWKITGVSPVKCRLSAARNTFTFSGEAPLNGLDIAFDNKVHKPAGVQGVLKAQVKQSDEVIDLVSASLVTAGMSVDVNGRLREKNGKPGPLNFEHIKIDLKESARYFPQLSGTKLSGPLTGRLTLTPQGDRRLLHGNIALSGVNLAPKDSAVMFEGLKGSLEAQGNTLSTGGITGRLLGGAEAPFTLTASFKDFEKTETLDGRVHVEGGPGKIKSEKITGALRQAMIIENLLNPEKKQAKDGLEFDTLSGDLVLKDGVVHSDNLKFHSKTFNAGAVGAYMLPTDTMDVTVGVKSAVNVGETVGKIPGVRKLIKDNRGLLKALGVDKELKRFGVDVEEEAPPNGPVAEGSEKPKASELLLFFKMRGKATSPEFAPIIESALGRDHALKLKALISAN